MLKKETVAKIASILKVKEADLTAALANEQEVDIEIPEGVHAFTQEELEARDTAQKNEGIKVGKEIGIKEVRTAGGLDESIGKDAKKVAEALTQKGAKDAKVPVDAKVQELTTQNQLLQQKLTEKDTEIETERRKAGEIANDRKILAAMPKNRSDVFEDDEYLDVIKSKHVKEVDGNLVVVGKDGQPLRDPKTTNVLGLQDGLKAIFTERKGWLSEGGDGGVGGRGGKDKIPPSGAFKKKSEVIKHYQEQGHSLNGEKGKEIVAHLEKLAKDDPDFDMNA